LVGMVRQQPGVRDPYERSRAGLVVQRIGNPLAGIVRREPGVGDLLRTEKGG